MATVDLDLLYGNARNKLGRSRYFGY
ncbi:hypothetical protein SPHINGO391_440065 [Sphingomonas aurantiaca]|uniref:Uncharacterized protein n=1 Tax=Sphingomonas aurantiaca TaxID=185949 RepID=A0A5E7Z3E3_9SPHN|nr:hypothetical protein SPHINGO391_440065 [Sphingomonas aurantiaca]